MSKQILFQFSRVVFGVVIGLCLGAALWSQAAPPKRADAPVLRARRFELVDAQGKVRGELGFDDSTLGGPRIVLKGNASGSEGGPSIRIERNNGHTITLGSGRDWLWVHDKDGRVLATIGESPAGGFSGLKTEIRLSNSSGETLQVSPDDTPVRYFDGKK